MSITALIPFLNGNREDWLNETLASLRSNRGEIRYVVCRNDGEMAEALNTGLAGDQDGAARS